MLGNFAIHRRDALRWSAAGLATAWCNGSAHARLIPDAQSVVSTATGRVQGAKVAGLHIFRGLPYGTPVGGKGRFRLAKPASPWTGIRDCTTYGDMAPQERVGVARIVPGASATRDTQNLLPVFSTSQSEDCLNLNIWTPALSGKRPVMVWLHSGGFEFGSGNRPLNDGTNLARQQDVVVVAINARLGVLGFLHLGELAGPDYAHSGNLGLTDIVLALRWVRQNIAAFGGDPDCVMVHGESGGGRKTSTLLAMPVAKGLFHRAAVQSGPGIRFPSNAIQSRRARYVLQELGLADHEVERLSEVPADLLVAAGGRASARIRREIPEDAPFYETYGFAPTIGPDLPSAPFDPAAPEISADIPLLIGTNREEMSYAFTQDPAYDVVSEAQYLEQATKLAGDQGGDLVRLYNAQYPQISLRERMIRLTSDQSHRIDSISIAQRKAAQGRAGVYMYRFDWQTPIFGGLMGAAHTYEIPHVFANAQLCAGMTGGAADAVAMAEKMSTAWANFARHGDPAAPPLPAWPRYGADHRATMVFDDECRVENDPGAAERQAWNAIFAARKDKVIA